MLRWLAASNPDMLVFGIESDGKECERLKSKDLPANAVLAEGDCRDFLESVSDSSVDLAFALFPDPSLIDKPHQASWLPFYHELFRKLKPGALFTLVTELTNDLLEPVSDAEFQRWTKWLASLFISIGFSVRYSQDAPSEYSSRCLDQFRGDEQRIRIATFDLVKPKSRH